jgi:chromosome segregation ATPase
MANKLTDAHRSLVRAKEAAKKRLEELDDERREIRASIKSLEAALKALGREYRRRVTSRPVIDVSVDDDDEVDNKTAIDGS